MIGNRIKQLREEKGLKQDELARQLSISPSTIGMYETNKREPNNDLTIRIANFFNVSVDYLLGLTNIREPIEGLKLDGFDDNYKRNIYGLYEYIQEHKKIDEQIENNEIVSTKHFYMTPVYGSISAGQPNWAEECIEGRLPIDPNMMNIVNPEEHFFLRVNGESMNKVIKNGAYALIHKQDVVDDGEIAVVLVNGYEATLKKFTRQGDFVVLEPQSYDDSFKTQIYDKNTPIKILGKYIGKFEMK